jgi:hypothetical protein
MYSTLGNMPRFCAGVLLSENTLQFIHLTDFMLFGGINTANESKAAD